MNSFRIQIFLYLSRSCILIISVLMLFSSNCSTKYTGQDNRNYINNIGSFSAIYKIDETLLQLIEKMTNENAFHNKNVDTTYSTDSICVDQSARIHIVLYMDPGSITDVIDMYVKAIGGIVHLIGSKNDYLRVECWVPYYKIKELAKFADIEFIFATPPSMPPLRPITR